MELNFGKDDLLYHYTSTDAFNSILRSDEKDLFYLRASRIDLLNDKEEESNFEITYREVCNELLQEGLLPEGLYQQIYNVPKSKTHYFTFRGKVYDPEWTGMEEIIYGYNSIPKEYVRYISCFTLDDDSLPMWNYYNQGNKFCGINIGFNALLFNFEATQRHNGCRLRLMRVIYDEKEKKNLLKNLILEFQSSFENGDKDLAEKLMAWKIGELCCSFKNRFFEYEKEVRLVCDIPVDIPDDSIDTEVFKVEYRERNGLFIPYITIGFPKYLVNTVRMGPLLGEERKETQKQIISDMLSGSGYSNVSVFSSHIPIRY